MLNPVTQYDHKSPQESNIRRKLIKDHLPLVMTIAGRVNMRCPTIIDYDDLVGWGVIGLIESADRFDPDKGVKFGTFAKPRIRGAMIDGLREMDWVARSIRRKAKEIQHAYGVLEKRLHRAATDEEVACELGISISEFHKALTDISRGAVLSLDEMIQVSQEGDTITLFDAVPDPEGLDPYLEYEADEIKTRLAQAINRLPEREKTVVSLYYYNDLMIKEIADLLGITAGRVSQLHTQAILRLRAHFSEIDN